MNAKNNYPKNRNQAIDALKIIGLIFLLGAIVITALYLARHDTNSKIFAKAKYEIVNHKIGYSQLYQYLADSATDEYPISSVSYDDRNRKFVEFTLEDTLRHEHSFIRETPLFIDAFTHDRFFDALFRRKTQSMYVAFPYVNYSFFETRIIYSKLQDNLIKKYVARGYRLANTIDDVSDKRNSMIKIDSNWVLLFYKQKF